MMSIAKIGYFVLTFVVLALVLQAYKAALTRIGKQKKQVNRNVLIVYAASLLWFVYLYFLGKSEILWSFEMPPRFPLFVFLPLVVLSIVIFARKANKELIQAVPKSHVIYFQSFRIFVELTILATYYEGIFPIETTFEGYNYEIIIGLIAPLVAYLVYSKKVLKEWGALLFNIAGLATLLIIIGIVITSLYFPAVWGSKPPVILPEFTTIPYLLLPGFLAPIALFTHVLSIIQIMRSKKK